MRKAKLDRSIALPPALIGSNYTPDGLTEADIDALIAETTADKVEASRPRPGWLSTDQIETRRSRRLARQGMRLLAANVLVDGVRCRDEVA